MLTSCCGGVTLFNMKVKELIELLKTQNSESLVVVSGYEGGYAEVRGASPLSVVLDYNKEWYLGSHEAVDDCRGAEVENYYQNGRVVGVVFLSHHNGPSGN